MKLTFEAWDDENTGTFSLIHAGPLGDKARSMLNESATMVRTFEAECNFDAMTQYYAYRGWGPYTTTHEQDYWVFKDASGKLDPTDIWHPGS